ncbi:hypothetical protein FO519_009074 [Halicephalobus sp. NKZ332]|nr:hypothetical protein FO519_009074 [Halicephalobus sp. NKZ332]
MTAFPLFFFLHLSLLVKSDFITDYVKLEDDIPDLSCPSCLQPDEDEKIGDLSWHRRTYFINIFSKAIFDPSCGKVPQPSIEVVYYHPGKRIDLSCKMCHKSLIYNGLPKKWKFMRENVDKVIGNLKLGSSGWKDLIPENVNTFHKSDDDERPRMPPISQSDEYESEDFKYHPRTKFFQRDGKLMIVHPNMDAFGLYHCFDEESIKSSLKHSYLLVPITPLYWMRNYRMNLKECPVEDIEYRRFDEHHLFHFFPAIFPKDASYCRNNSFGGNKCYTAVFNEERQPHMDHITNFFWGISRGNEKSLKEKINLKIFLQWSEWSSCDPEKKVRTRMGYCRIKKENPEIFVNDGTDFEGFPMEQLHRFLENVEEFRKNGIILFSGVMAALLNTGHNPATHCTNYNQKRWEIFNLGVITKIIWATDEPFSEYGITGVGIVDSVCFRGPVFPDEERSRMNQGHKVIQNELC